MALQRADFFYQSPSRHAKQEGPLLTPSEADFYTRLSDLTHDGQLFVFWNSETHSHPGVFTHPNAAKGYSVGLSKEMPLEKLIVAGPADEPRFLLSSRWFSHTAVVKIPRDAVPAGMTEKDMADVVARLSHRLSHSPNFSNERAELGKSILNIGSSRAGAKDAVEWTEAVHGHGNFAGLYKEHSKDIATSSQYYLVVHSDADLVGEALSGYAIEHPQMTLGEFAASPQMDAVKSYSRRNAYRVLATMVDALALDRKKIAIVQDLHAATSESSTPAELVAEPFVDTVSNVLYDPVPNGKHLFYYNGTTRLATMDPIGRRVVMLKNPKQGLSIISLDGQKDYTMMRHNVIAGPNESHLVSHANPHAALPVGLGRLQGDSTAVLKMSKLTLDDAHELHRTFIWAGRSDSVTMSGPADVQAHLDHRLYSYKPLSQDLKNLVQFMLGDGTQVTNLKPVKVIMAAHKYN